jgi:hypothetical protein
MILYEGARRSLKVRGHEEVEFYCGDSLDTLAVVLIKLKHGDMSLQDSYTHLSKWMLEAALKGEMVLTAQDGELFVSKSD